MTVLTGYDQRISYQLKIRVYEAYQVLQDPDYGWHRCLGLCSCLAAFLLWIKMRLTYIL